MHGLRLTIKTGSLVLKMLVLFLHFFVSSTGAMTFLIDCSACHTKYGILSLKPERDGKKWTVY